MLIVVDRRRVDAGPTSTFLFGADPDLHPTFHFDADPDLHMPFHFDADPDPTPSFTLVGKSNFSFELNDASLHSIISLVSVIIFSTVF